MSRHGKERLTAILAARRHVRLMSNLCVCRGMRLGIPAGDVHADPLVCNCKTLRCSVLHGKEGDDLLDATTDATRLSVGRIKTGGELDAKPHERADTGAKGSLLYGFQDVAPHFQGYACT